MSDNTNAEHMKNKLGNLCFKEKLLRLGLASFALLFMEARGQLQPETAKSDLQGLCERNLLTPAEVNLLVFEPSRSQVLSYDTPL
jgi:hypothetical protein